MHAPTTTTTNGWLWNLLMDGLTKLVTLSLDRQPAGDLIDVTAGTWFSALTYKREWIESQDAARVVEAFRALEAGSRWPVPFDFLAALPELPRTYHVAPVRISSDAIRESAAVAFAELAKSLASRSHRHDAP